MRKKLALLLAGAMTLSLMVGCGNSKGSTSKSSASQGEDSSGSDSMSPSSGGEASPKGGVTLSLYMNADDLAKSYIQKIIALYEEESGNKIDQQGLETSNAESIALTKFTTGDIPDLYVHFGNTGLKNFNPKENFVDWSDAEWVDDLTTGSLSQATYEDRIVGLPFWEASNSGCFYNKTLFGEMNLELPTTQAEFDALCDTLLEKGIQPIYLAGGDTWPLLYLKNFNPKENFVDWSDAEWVDDLTTGSLSQATYEDRIVGLPFWEASNSGCFYNKTLFGEMNLELPTTQAEFDALCDTLLEKGIQPIYLAGGDTWPLLYQFALDPVMEEHPEYIEKLNAGEMTYGDIPEFRDMCEWFQSAAQKGYFGKTFASDSWDYCSEVLGTGEAAMMLVWDTWFDTDYDGESYDYSKEDFGMMPMFLGTCDEGTYEGGNLNLFMVNKNSERVETAKEFIAFMADPDNYNVAFDGVSTSSVFKGQTTNVTSIMYRENKENVDTLLRASIANPKIIGFSQNEGAKALIQLMSGDISVDDCIAYIDADRIATLESFSE